MHLPVAARVDEHRRAGLERLARVLVRGADGPVAAQDRTDGGGEDEVVGELVEGPLDAEVGAEGEREDDRVGRQVAAGVVADQQHRAALGDVLQVADLAPEPERRDQPVERQVLADVVGVAVVEIGVQP